MGSAMPAKLSIGISPDRKSTRLNSSHSQISYAVFCLKKKRTEGAAEARAPRPGEEFEGKYRIERELGIGCMRGVLPATHLHLGEPVALYFFFPGAAATEISTLSLHDALPI